MQHVYIFRFDANPERDDLLIRDVRVGRYSQTACYGTFKAVILRRLPPLRFDPDPKESAQSAAVMFEINGRNCDRDVHIVEIETDQEWPFVYLFPVGRTQVAGKLVEIVTTAALFRAVEQGAVKICVEETPSISNDKEGPTKISETSIKDMRLRPDAPVPFDVSSRFAVTFSGPAAGEYGPTDVVGLLEPFPKV